MFFDGSNEIQVELDDDIYLNVMFMLEIKVCLFGEFENGCMFEIEVDYIELL